MNLLTIPETARRLSVSRTTVYRLIADGELDHTDVGRKGFPRARVVETSLNAYITRRTTRVGA